MTLNQDAGPLTADHLDSLVAVLNAVRSDRARTRPELARLLGLGRNVVTQRVAQLLQAGLVAEGVLGPSTGGRAPRKLRFRAEAGWILVAELGAASIAVAICDLHGQVIAVREEPADVTAGPEPVLEQVAALFDVVLAEQGQQGEPVQVWGIGVGLPGPVEFATGRPIAPPIMPGWDGYDVRGYLAERFNAPTWVDNDVNVLALGELRGGLAQGQRDVVYVKIGTGIGAGLVSGGRLHRGAQGCAGDIGHISIYDVDFVPIEGADAHSIGNGLTYVDHLTHNVHRGRMKEWADFYERLFNFREVRYFDIEGKLTGLKSKAMTSPCGKIRIPINESSDDKSQIAEYLDLYHGEGIQHIAMGTDDIYATVDGMKTQGVAFQDTILTYYDLVNRRLPKHGENLDELKRLRILVDGATHEGAPNELLLQIFTQTVIGPIFFEVIQRKGDQGFGEGNFRALFESIELDQVRRGVLKDETATGAVK